MINIDCPWCEAPIMVEGLESAIRCDGCSVEVELAEDDSHEIRRAA